MKAQSEENLMHTPLFEYYQAKGVKLVDFGGWALPIQYTSILKEHKAVRERAGLFEVSHMGQLVVAGANAMEWLNSLVTNDLSTMRLYQAQYNAVCKEDGGTLDDVIILKLADDRFFLTPNASNTTKIYDWLKAHKVEGVSVQNVSQEYGLLALQGPLAETILQRVTDTPLADIKPFSCLPDVRIDGDIHGLLSRTGYTGEDGFEIYCSAPQTERLFELILHVGQEEDILPCGLGARDTLRLEKAYPLYGQELSESISPIQAGIGFVVKTKTKKADFIGKHALATQRANGPDQVVCGFQLVGRGIPRTGYTVFNDAGDAIGTVTSGSQSPTLGTMIGLALLNKEYQKVGTSIFVEIRNKHIEATVVATPFYVQK